MMNNISKHTHAHQHSYVPVIGISGSSPRSASVVAMKLQIEHAGMCPVILEHDTDALQDQLNSLSGVVIMGNNHDIDPKDYGQPRSRDTHIPTKTDPAYPAYKQRMTYETALVQEAIEQHIPLMGICGGMQRINVTPDRTHTMQSGTLMQSLDHMEDAAFGSHQNPTEHTPPYTPVHLIQLQEGTNLLDIAQHSKSWIPSARYGLPDSLHLENSLHHQAINKVREGFQVAAKGYGGITEAIEPEKDGIYADQFILGLQWHPEFNASSLGQKIIERFSEAAHTYQAEHRTEVSAEHVWQQRLPKHTRQVIDRVLAEGTSFTNTLFSEAILKQREHSPAMAIP